MIVIGISIPELAVTFITNVFIWFVRMIFQFMLSIKFSSFKAFNGGAGYTDKQFSFSIFFFFTI